MSGLPIESTQEFLHRRLESVVDALEAAVFQCNLGPGIPVPGSIPLKVSYTLTASCIADEADFTPTPQATPAVPDPNN